MSISNKQFIMSKIKSKQLTKEFNLFLKDIKKDLKGQHLHPTEVNRIAAKRWRTLTNAELEIYIKEANKLRPYKSYPKQRRIKNKKGNSSKKRPLNNFMLFLQEIREELNGQHLRSTEIARIAGERWKRLANEERSVYDEQAKQALCRYMRRSKHRRNY